MRLPYRDYTFYHYPLAYSANAELKNRVTVFFLFSFLNHLHTAYLILCEDSMTICTNKSRIFLGDFIQSVKSTNFTSRIKPSKTTPHHAYSVLPPLI